MDDKELNRAISQAKSAVGKKLDRIRKREDFSDAVMRILDPRRNKYVPHMSRQEKESFLSTLNNFRSKNTNYYKDAHGNPITQEQWNEYKNMERAANRFVSNDIKKYGKIKMPLGDFTVAQRQEKARPQPGVMSANPSGSGMFLTNRKPNQVVAATLDNLIDSLAKRLDPGYKARKTFEGRDQFEKMVTVIGDNELIQRTRNLTDEQFWVLWNYTDSANSISLEYTLLMEGMRTGVSKDAALGISQTSRSKVHRYVEWASQI